MEITETKDKSVKNNIGLYAGIVIVVIAVVASIIIFVKTRKSCK